MTTPAQLSQALNRSAEQVCKHLLPHGKRIGHEWCAGDAYGGEGRSLKIVLEGEKAGVGSDFATGEVFGDLLDLWCTTQSVGLSEAMAQACSYLGIVNDGQDSRPKKEYKRPPKPKSVQRLNKEGKVYQYLKSRGFTDQCLEDFRISEDQGQWMVFPYLREGLFINAKYIHIERTPEGKKQCRQEKEAEPCLFGWDALELRYPTTRFVILTEGEGDTLTYHQCGLPALSIPNGGGGGKKQDWIDQDYDRLSRFDTIYLSMDNDGPGKEAEKEIITRLGSERIRVIQLPYKDANECFAKGIKTFHRYLLSSKCLDPAELKPADYFTDEVLDKFFPKPGSYQGMKTPWANVTQALKFQREQLIIWTGYSGSGKALALDTPIPTIFGWKNMGDLVVGDFVFDERGWPCRVVGTTEVMLNRPCYKVTFSDGCEIVADANHEWLTDTIHSRISQYHSKRNGRDTGRKLEKRGRDQVHNKITKSIVTTQRIMETLVVYQGKNLDPRVNHSIDVAGGLLLPAEDLPIDPYVLGLWLGDGNSDGSGFTTSDEELTEAFVRAGFIVKDRKNAKFHYSINGFCTVAREHNLYKNKHIPKIYLRASYHQRLALLQGLMDTDGYADDSKCEFCSTNKTLAYQVLELTRTMGIRSYMCLGRAKLYEKDCGEKYRVMFTTDIPVFRLKRKLDKLKSSVSIITKRRFIVACDPVESVPVRCIQVDSDSHLYLAGESMIPTHNSTVLNQVAAQGMVDNEKFCICSLEMPSKVTLYRMVRQITGEARPDEATIRRAMQWLSDKCWMVHILGTVKTQRVLEVFKYAVKRYDIRNFICDSLTKVGIREDDYDGQKSFVDQLCDFNHQYEATTHLVVHQRKPESEANRPGKFGVRGAAAITDEASSVISIWRRPDPADEEPQPTYGRKKKIEPSTEDHPPDTILSIVKNRETGVEGKFGLWFENSSLQYHEMKFPVSKSYLDRRIESETF